MQRAYARIIASIHFHRNHSFAIWEISEDSKTNRKTVRKVCERLHFLRYLYKKKRALNSCFWKVTKKWPSLNPTGVIEDYETDQIVQTLQHEK